MNVPGDLKYAKSHEWVRVDADGVATVGITDFAQAEMTSLVYVELPDVGRDVTAGESVAVVESVKSASDIYAPVSGQITAVNEDLAGNPGQVNEDAFGDGWLMKIRLTSPDELDELFDADAYRKEIGS